MSSANIILHESIFEFVMEAKMGRLDRKLKNGEMTQDEYDKAMVLLDQEATNYYKSRRDWSF
jgi:hypothetical protein